MQVKTVFLLAIAAPAVEGIKVHEADPCACLNWKDAYAKMGMSCGDTGRELAGGLDFQQGCKMFFQRIDDDFCVNWDFDGASLSTKQWCYVSSECKELGEGTRSLSRDKTRISAYKTCTDKDQKLVMKKPYELAQVAVKDDLDLSVLARWAYPVAGKIGSATDADKNMTKNMTHATLWSPDAIVSAHGTSHFVISQQQDGVTAFTEGRMGDVNELTCLPLLGPCCGPDTGAECASKHNTTARAWWAR